MLLGIQKNGYTQVPRVSGLPRVPVGAQPTRYHVDVGQTIASSWWNRRLACKRDPCSDRI